MNHEEALIMFIVPHRQERYLGFLVDSKKRKRLIAELAHFKALDPKVIVNIPPNRQKPSAIMELLTAKGAGPTCWVVSENPELDGKQMALAMALKETVGHQMGTFISCLPGKLAYFEDEDGRCILER